MLKILGRKNSGNTQKVLWCCDELGIAYEREDAGRGFGRNHEPAYLALNPNGRVPTIVDDGFSLWESNVIVRYLCAKHGMGTLCPSAPQRRADAERCFATSSIAGTNCLSGMLDSPISKHGTGGFASVLHFGEISVTSNNPAATPLYAVSAAPRAGRRFRDNVARRPPN